MVICVKSVDIYKYIDSSQNKYDYYVLKTKGCSHLYWLIINGVFIDSFDNYISMLNDISYRKLIKM